MRIVLFGKNGQLGWEFQHSLPALGEVISFGRDQVDLSKPDALEVILSDLKPNLIINASAYTNVDLAEKEADIAMKINAVAPGIMASMARKLNAVFIHYSTDYVFDGRKGSPYIESDATHPLNMYGKSKLMGEENIQQAGGAYLILRTSWVYSLRGETFVNKVLGWARKNTKLKIVSDQVGSPTWARTLAEITSNVLANYNDALFDKIHERRGVYHLAGRGYTSRYEWAKQILADDPNRTEQLVQTIEPVSSVEFPTPALRPLFTALNCANFEKTFGVEMPEWSSMLKRAMA